MLWHLKSPDLPKAPSQSPRIPLWHLKSHTLPKAPSQSPRIPLWHLKSHTLPKAPSQSPRIQLALNSDSVPSSKASTGKLSKNSALQNSGAFVPLQRETLFFWQNPVAKAAKAVNRQTIAKSAAFCSFGTRRW